MNYISLKCDKVLCQKLTQFLVLNLFILHFIILFGLFSNLYTIV